MCFARVAYGEFAGFVVGASNWFVNTVGLTLVAVAFAEYANALATTAGGIGGLAAGVVVALRP